MIDEKKPHAEESLSKASHNHNENMPLIEIFRSKKNPPKKTLLQTIRESKRPRPVLHYQVPPKIQPSAETAKVPLGLIFRPLKLSRLRKTQFSPRPRTKDGRPWPGRLIARGVVLEKHEMRTVAFLLSLGYDIELVPRSREVGVHTPDIRMQGLEWEIKSPRGRSRNVIKNTIQKAEIQSDNIIIDLVRSRISEEKCIRAFERQLYLSSNAKRMKIITKDRHIIDFLKPSDINNIGEIDDNLDNIDRPSGN